MNAKLIQSVLRNIRHISRKLLMKAFVTWVYVTPKNNKKLKTSKVFEKPPKCISSPVPFKTFRNEGSPRDVSLRLYNKAQEIENHKNEMRKSLIPDYSFTPKLSNGNQKWLTSKSRKEFKGNSEEVAVVSGSKVLGFSQIESEFKGLSTSKIPGLPLGKTRVVTSRLDRRSDIVSAIFERPENLKGHHKSSSKFL